MEVVDYQPTIGPILAEPGCGSSEWAEEESRDVIKPPIAKGDGLKQLLYDYSRKPDSEISDQDIHEYFVKRGGDPNHKLTESEIWSIRFVLDNWRDWGDLLILPYDEISKRLFISDEEFKKLEEEAEAACKLRKAQRNQPGEPKYFCEVCMQTGDHTTSMCPYWKDVPDPDNTVVGDKYVIICHHCHKSDHGHPKGKWGGFVFEIGSDEQFSSEPDTEPDSDDDKP